MQIFLGFFILALMALWFVALVWSLIVPTDGERHGIRWRRPPHKTAAALVASLLGALIALLFLSNTGASQ